jgi:hypothetical protein
MSTYPVAWNNKFFRVHAVTTDKYGIDPYMDKIIPSLLKIQTYTNHEVTQDERGGPDLISLREYGTEDFWWHIMAYNGICRFRQVVQGQTVKIPDMGAIIDLTNSVLVQDTANTTAKIVTI